MPPFANGDVNVETNGRDNGRSATYTYDALNRAGGAYVPTVFVEMYATQGGYDVQVSKRA